MVAFAPDRRGHCEVDWLARVASHSQALYRFCVKRAKQSFTFTKDSSLIHSAVTQQQEASLRDYFDRRIKTVDILTSIPVRVNATESIPAVLANVTDRISRRAYENYIQGGSVDGQDLDDWLNAERELVIKPAFLIRAHGKDVFVEVTLPAIDLPNLTVHVASNQIIVVSDPDEDGLQVCQVIDLPFEIILDGVDAEQLHNILHLTASVAQA